MRYSLNACLMIRFHRNDKTIVADRDQLILDAASERRIRLSNERVIVERRPLIS